MLYLGDTSLSTAACYLAGVLHRAGYTFEYRPSDHQLNSADLAAAALARADSIGAAVKGG